MFIKKKVESQLKNKIQEMFLWWKMLLWRENHKEEIWLLIYVMTLGTSSLFKKKLENVV